MAGNASNADDDELPNLDDNEAENESTVAMEAPSFDHRGGVLFPVGKPAPKPAEAPPAAAATPAEPPAPVTPASPPAKASTARTPAAPAARAPGVAARPAFAAAPPKGAAGMPAGKLGKQTVIGLAPPAARPAGMSPGPRAPVAAPTPAPSASSGRSAFAATFPSAPSPSPSHGATAPGGGSRAEGASGPNDASTVTVPKDVLDRVRANPKAVLAESEKQVLKIQHDDDDDGNEETKLAESAKHVLKIQHDDDDEGYEETKLAEAAPAAPANQAPPKVHEDDDDHEETRAVPREEFLRQQDAHVVVGADATGDDATLAVPPSSNEAALLNNIGAAIGESLQHPPVPAGGYPPAYGGAPQHQHQAPHMGMGGTMGMPAQAGWSSGHLPVAPRVPGGVASYGGAPMMGPQGGNPHAQGPANWSPPLGAPPAARRISGQMIVLLIVGFVCLAIFVTGIVLFATTF